MTDRKILDGWKEISNFLGVTERTARRWQKEDGLPVYQRGKGKRVYAFEEEILDWLKQKALNKKERNKIQKKLPEKWGKRKNKGKKYLTIAFLIIFIFIYALTSSMEKKSEAHGKLMLSIKQFGNRIKLTIFNQQNKKILTLVKETTIKVKTNRKMLFYDIGDLNGDGLEDFVYHSLNQDENNTVYVYLQNKNGELNLFRKKQITGNATFEGKNLKLSHIHLIRIADMDNDGKAEIWVGLNHLVFYPSALICFDYRLKEKKMIITHPGWFFDIRATDLNHDGKNEVYICATNNYLQKNKSEAVSIAIDLKGKKCKTIHFNNPLKKEMNPFIKCNVKAVYVRLGYNLNIIAKTVWQYPEFCPEEKTNKTITVFCDNFITDTETKDATFEKNLRDFVFNYMYRNLITSFWNTAYLDKLKIKIPERDFKELLKCRYFNGEKWENGFCYYPTKKKGAL